MKMTLDTGPEPSGEFFVRSLIQAPPAGATHRGPDPEPAIASIIVFVAPDPAQLALAEPLLKSEGYDVRIVPDAVRAAHAAAADAPTCVVLCRALADETLAPEIEALRRECCDCPIIVLCEHVDAEAAIGMISGHGVPFIIGPDALERLSRQVRAALDRDIDTRRRAVLVDAARDGVRKLTPREHEILMLLLRGMCNKEMASELGLSVKTIETHRSRVLHKLGVVNIAEFSHLLLILLT